MTLKVSNILSSANVGDMPKGMFITFKAGENGRLLALVGEARGRRVLVFLGAIGLGPEHSRPAIAQADIYKDELAVSVSDVHIEVKPATDGFPVVARSPSNGAIHISQSGEAWIYIREPGLSAYFNLNTGDAAQASPGEGWFSDWCLVQYCQRESASRVLYESGARNQPSAAAVSPLNI